MGQPISLVGNSAVWECGLEVYSPPTGSVFNDCKQGRRALSETGKWVEQSMVAIISDVVNFMLNDSIMILTHHKDRRGRKFSRMVYFSCSNSNQWVSTTK